MYFAAPVWAEETAEAGAWVGDFFVYDEGADESQWFCGSFAEQAPPRPCADVREELQDELLRQEEQFLDHLQEFEREMLQLEKEMRKNPDRFREELVLGPHAATAVVGSNCFIGS